MSTEVQWRRGTRAEHNNFVGQEGEITVVENEWSLRVHDNVTPGGHPINGVIRHSATLSSPGWYRIAQTAQGINGNLAQFVINWDAGDDDLGQAMFVATCDLGNTPTSQNVQINELAYATRNNGTGVTYARIVYAPDYEGGYAYLEVYLANSGTTEFFFTVSGAIGWRAMAPVAGSVPAGYNDRTVWLGYDHVLKRRVITTQNESGWYRVASSPVSVGRNHAIFKLDWTAAEHHHGQALFVAATNFGYERAVELRELSFSGMGRGTGITKVRLIYPDDYPDNHAYLEVFLASDVETIFFCSIIDPIGWLLMQPETGGIPANHTPRELTFEGGDPYEFGGYLPGQPEGDTTLLRYVFTRTVTFQQHLSGSIARVEVEPASNTVFPLMRNGVEFATMTFPAGQKNAEFSFSVPDSQIIFRNGDEISVLSPTQDPSLAGIYFSLKGLRGEHYYLAEGDDSGN